MEKKKSFLQEPIAIYKGADLTQQTLKLIINQKQEGSSFDNELPTNPSDE